MKHQEFKQLLPEIFQRTDQPGSPLYGLLQAVEGLSEPAELILQQLPVYFDPYATPDNFLPFLASWVDLDRFFTSTPSSAATDKELLRQLDSGRLRELIVAATRLSKLRGTAAGLQLFLETATGIQGFIIDENVLQENNDVIPFHIKISAPKAAQKYQVMIERIIEQEKPVYVTHYLEFSPH
ncbi:phage tail protein [Nitrosomonas marina]|uniref:Phage tail protein domain-containing protein n=1 Tax=Nitrosomonas marina TaxID=917 RepID=A0A1H8GB39_9PROT|nr:phage tail protein [Nitrosomonas marina]SEN40974.1 phage tail protein domain-containing protein [Nitrosomonas marina]